MPTAFVHFAATRQFRKSLHLQSIFFGNSKRAQNNTSLRERNLATRQRTQRARPLPRQKRQWHRTAASDHFTLCTFARSPFSPYLADFDFPRFLSAKWQHCLHTYAVCYSPTQLQRSVQFCKISKIVHTPLWALHTLQSEHCQVRRLSGTSPGFLLV